MGDLKNDKVASSIKSHLKEATLKRSASTEDARRRTRRALPPCDRKVLGAQAQDSRPALNPATLLQRSPEDPVDARRVPFHLPTDTDVPSLGSWLGG